MRKFEIADYYSVPTWKIAIFGFSLRDALRRAIGDVAMSEELCGAGQDGNYFVRELSKKGGLVLQMKDRSGFHFRPISKLEADKIKLPPVGKR